MVIKKRSLIYLLIAAMLFVQFADTLIQDLSKWSWKGLEASLDDDLTLVVVDVENDDMV